MAQPVALWGATVIAVKSLTEGTPYLSSIIQLTIEDEQIVKWKDYYFSTEFLTDAARELGIEVDKTKELYGNIV